MALRQETTPRATAIYCRISEDQDGTLLGVRRQEEDCRELASKRGWPVTAIYVDNDVSAYSGRARPQYRAMLEAVGASEIDGIIVWHLDRLHRRPRELEDFFDTCDQAGLKHMASVSGDIDLSTHDGRFQARILGAVARKESDDKSRRIRRKHEELARDGRPLGGVTTPFGYRYDPAKKKLTKERTEARIVKKIFEDYAGGLSLRAIMRGLNDRGVVGQRGRRLWNTTSALTRILDNPTYAGFRHYQGELTKGQWSAIVSRDLFDRVQAMRLAGRAETPAKNRAGKGNSTLSGLLFCTCGAAMWRDSYKSDESKSTYVCSLAARKHRGDCRAGDISATRAERIVADAFLEKVGAPFARRVMRAPSSRFGVQSSRDEDDVDRRLAAIEKKMTRLVEISIEQTGPLAAKTFRRKAQQLEAEKAAAEKEQAQRVAAGATAARRAEDLETLRKQVANLPGVWAAATLEERNQMLRLAMDRVNVITTVRPKQLGITWAGWLEN